MQKPSRAKEKEKREQIKVRKGGGRTECKRRGRKGRSKWDIPGGPSEKCHRMKAGIGITRGLKMIVRSV